MDNYSVSGELANNPFQISWRSWKSILKRVKEEIKDDHMTLLSAGMTFYALLSIIPILTSAVIIYSLAFDISTITGHLSDIAQFFPEKYRETFQAQLTSMLSVADTKLGWGLAATLFISLWSGSKASKGLIESLNIIYEEEDERGFFKKNLLALGITILAVLVGIISLTLIIGLPVALQMFNLGKVFEILISISTYIALIGIASFFMAFIYKIAPARDNPKWRWVSLGSVCATVLWIGFSVLFSWYISRFGSYDKTYGSLGAVVALMMWIYLSSNIILLGAQINAEQERQTDIDSTVGEAEPKGERDARMADY